MRKLWYAGAAVAGGILLFGAAPAQADLLPGTGTAEQQADERLTDLLGRTNGITVDPLGHSSLNNTPAGQNPLLQYRSGRNTPELDRVLPGEPRPSLPAADVVGGALRRPSASRPHDHRPVHDLPIRQFPIRSLPLFGIGGLPLLGGLLPDGGRGIADDRTTMRQAEMFDGGMPLLGGLGGVLPVNEAPRTLPARAEPDTSGLPAGGTAVRPGGGTKPGSGAKRTRSTRPATTPSATAATPAASEPPAGTGPAAAQDRPARPGPAPQPTATPDDPRLHEEPIDDETTEQRRPFSADGRPIAGIDEEYR